MSSTFKRELRWVVENVVLLVAYLYLFLLAQAAVALVLSNDGSVAEGWGGHPVSQVLGWAMFGGAILAMYAPASVVVLLPYRAIVSVFGHARLVAIAAACVAIGAVWVALQDVDASIRLVIGVAILGYAMVVRLPGDDFASLPPLVSGLIVGLALSTVWLVGSIVGSGYGLYRSTSPRSRTYGGSVALASSVVPGLILFADLFRAHVPAANYVITLVLLAGAVAGLLVLVWVNQGRGRIFRLPRNTLSGS